MRNDCISLYYRITTLAVSIRFLSELRHAHFHGDQMTARGTRLTWRSCIKVSVCSQIIKMINLKVGQQHVNRYTDKFTGDCQKYLNFGRLGG